MPWAHRIGIPPALSNSGWRRESEAWSKSTALVRMACGRLDHRGALSRSSDLDGSFGCSRICFGCSRIYYDHFIGLGPPGLWALPSIAPRPSRRLVDLELEAKGKYAPHCTNTRPFHAHRHAFPVALPLRLRNDPTIAGWPFQRRLAPARHRCGVRRFPATRSRIRLTARYFSI